MDYLDIRFPEDIAAKSIGGPEFSTTIITNSANVEQRIINWLGCRCKYNVSYGVCSKEQLRQLLALFRNCYGRAKTFRFKDWMDCRGNNEYIATADGKTISFQLQKCYDSSEQMANRIITKPVLDTVIIYFNGDKCNIDYSVNYQNGIITFASPPLNNTNISADFEFDVMVRFDSDYLPTSLENYGLNSANNIALVEVV